MSTDASDSRESHCSSGQQLIKKKYKKPPFNLYFAKCHPLGHSDFRVSKLDGVIKFVANFITPKFYTRGTNEDEQNHERLKEILAKSRDDDESRNHRGRDCIPLLSSQSYGWWYDRKLNSNDPRFNFHKNTSDMVHSNLMIQWEDEKLRGLCH